MSAGRLRLSVPADNAALLDLFGSVPMEGDLVLSTRRDPDFFALYDIQRGIRECWVYENARGPAGLGTVLVREGWLDGRPCRVGYLGDLRSTISASRERGLVRVYGDTIAEAGRRHGCEHFLTAVLASNTAALHALVRRRETRASQPRYRLLRRFAMVSIQFLPAWPAGAGRWRVRSASDEDIPAIVSLLDRDHRARPFGYRYDQGEFEHRLAAWPGMSLERTYLAFDPQGRLCGVTSAWDPAAVKRYRVVDYRAGMRWTRRVLDATAALLGGPRMPDPGDDFRCLYLCNTACDDPSILRALLRRIHLEQRRSGYHFFALCVYEGDPLAPALRGFVTQRTDFHLYMVTRADQPEIDLPPGRPGFEMALA